MRRLLYVCCVLTVSMQLSSAQTNAFPSSGNVGVGTNSPASKLHVVNGAGEIQFLSGTTNSSAEWYSTATGSNNDPSRLNFRRSRNGSAVASGDNIFWLFGYGHDGTDYSTISSGMQMQVDGTVSAHRVPGRIQFFTAPGTADNDYAERMRISSTGNVGIGSVDPQAKLDIYANGYPSMYLTNGYNTGVGQTAGLEFRQQTSGNLGLSTNARPGGAIKSIASGAFIAGDGSTYNASLALFSSSAGSLVENMRLIANGSVGIGTSTPSEKLSVEGNITANGFVKAKKLWVTQLGWSDYVFNEDYKLRSLSSVESFIKQNKRLPDVPSAKEVQENGISIGDSQALLLKKIEELTLYVIELKKEINQLKRRK